MQQLRIATPVLGLVVVVLVALTSGQDVSAVELSCMDEDGHKVDWFIGYKFPLLGSDKFDMGKAYSFITDEDVKTNGDEADELEEELENRKEVDDDSRIFLHRFKDLLLKCIGYKSPEVVKRPKKKLASRKQKDTKKLTSWVASSRPIDDPESVIWRTLLPAYDEKLGASVSSVYYNDDPTNTGYVDSRDTENLNESELWKMRLQNGRRAHAKGVLLMDEESGTGVWLTHSVPKFPTIRGGPLQYPSSGYKNGQSFMCISFDVNKSGKKLIDHLVNMRPLVYDNRISPKMLAQFPALENLDRNDQIGGRRVKVEPKLTQMITTRGGQVLSLFSKSISFNQDMYSGWIDEEVGSDMYVETWRNGKGGKLDSACPAGNYHVNNIQDLKYDNQVSWSYVNDHSKWAISERPEVGVVCIADSNRMRSQFKRGGGAVCIKCPTCWKIFDNTIKDVEPCPIGPTQAKRVDATNKTLISRIRTALNL